MKPLRKRNEEGREKYAREDINCADAHELHASAVHKPDRTKWQSIIVVITRATYLVCCYLC